MCMRLALLLSFISFYAIGQSNQALKFVQNKGQWNDEIDYQALVPGGRVGVSAIGFSIVLLDGEEMERRHLAGHQHGAINESNGQTEDEPIKGHYFKINLIGSNPQAQPVVDTPLDGYYNYFIGNDPCHWASNAAAFATILYPEVYKGIDFRVSSIGNDLKYDFIVKPGADPSQIRLEYVGVDGVEKTEADLEIKTSIGLVTEQQPYSYQGEGVDKRTVASEYRVHHNGVTFSFPEGYDECSTLVIDPLLIFSTYSGSTADNWGSTATPGEHGTLYSAGVTHQNAGGFFPATTGAFQVNNHGSFDMAVIKYDSAGTKFLYATHLGGGNNDSPQSLVVDKASGDLLVLGISSSPDYPTSANAFDPSFNFGVPIFNRVLVTTDQWDIVLTRLTPTGDQLVGSTFLGGSANDGLNLPKQMGGPLVVNYGDEMRGDVITDDAGNVYISSVTGSSDFPIVNGFDQSFNGGMTDGLLVKLNPDLSSIVWSSFVGGSGFDAAYSIKLDNSKNIVLAGGTNSADFPVTAGSFQTVFNGVVDGWIARVAADGSSIINATFTGTFSFDQVYFIDLNSSGNIFCYGQTAGPMPVTNGVYNNPNSGQFLQKFTPDLRILQFSTVFGSGSTNGLIIPNISPTAFLVNDCDNIYMSGWGGFVNSAPETGFWQSSTHGMPITNDAYQTTTSGSDFYFIVLNGDASKLVYSTYLGGNSSKTHVDGGTSRFDKYGIVYHSVCSGCAFGNSTLHATSDFPTTPGAKSRLNASTNCNNAAFKFDLSSLTALFDTNNMARTMPGFNNVCYPDTIVFENFSTGGRLITWEFGDGTIINQTNMNARWVTHQYQQTGHYAVKITITDLSTCAQSDSYEKTIHYFRNNITVCDDGAMCDGESFQLTASGGVDYAWTGENGQFSSNDASPIVQPASAATYYVTVVDANGCSKKDTVNVTITPNVRAAFQTYDALFTTPGYNNVCYPEQIRFKNQSVNGETFTWDFGDGTIRNQTRQDTVSMFYRFPGQGVYQVQLKAMNPNTCNKVDYAVKTIRYYEQQIYVGDDGEICEDTPFQLTASGGTHYAWVSDDNAFTSGQASPVVTPAHTTKYYVTATDSHDCVRKDTVEVVVLNIGALEWAYQFDPNCSDRPYLYAQNLTTPVDEVSYHFDFGDGTTTTDTDIQHVYEKDGMYVLKLIAERKFCTVEEQAQLPVFKLVIPNVITPEGSPGYNDTFEIGFGPDAIIPSEMGLPVQLTVTNRWGERVFESQDYQNNWNGKNLEGGVYYINVKLGDVTTCRGWLHIMK